MNAFFVSLLTVAIAEIGDRSLLVAALFGMRYRRPWPVFWGMALGLFVNQAISALFGVWLFSVISREWHAVLVGLAFVAMAVWILVPEDTPVTERASASSIFVVSAVTFFVLEMADKTQLAVITLAGAFERVVPVVAGATLGILLVTTPALWLGHRFAARLPVRVLKLIASVLFALTGVWLLIGAALSR